MLVDTKHFNSALGQTYWCVLVADVAFVPTRSSKLMMQNGFEWLNKAVEHARSQIARFRFGETSDQALEPSNSPLEPKH